MSPFTRLFPTLVALGILTSLSSAQNTAGPVLKKPLQDDDTPFYGTEHEFILATTGHFSPRMHENSAGTYEGIGAFGGDRRFAPYHRHYTLVIKDDGGADKIGSIGVRSIQIIWKSSTTFADAKNTTHIDYDPNGGKDTIDNIDYQIKDAYFDGINLWGNMTYQTTKGEAVVKMPFLALWGNQASENQKEDGPEGILLMGRYEGPVFLKKIK